MAGSRRRLKRNEYTKRLSLERLEMIEWKCIKELLWPEESLVQCSRFRRTNREAPFGDSREYLQITPLDLSWRSLRYIIISGHANFFSFFIAFRPCCASRRFDIIWKLIDKHMRLASANRSSGGVFPWSPVWLMTYQMNQSIRSGIPPSISRASFLPVSSQLFPTIQASTSTSTSTSLCNLPPYRPPHLSPFIWPRLLSFVLQLSPTLYSCIPAVLFHYCPFP